MVREAVNVDELEDISVRIDNICEEIADLRDDLQKQIIFLREYNDMLESLLDEREDKEAYFS